MEAVLLELAKSSPQLAIAAGSLIILYLFMKFCLMWLERKDAEYASELKKERAKRDSEQEVFTRHLQEANTKMLSVIEKNTQVIEKSNHVIADNLKVFDKVMKYFDEK